MDAEAAGDERLAERAKGPLGIGGVVPEVGSLQETLRAAGSIRRGHVKPEQTTAARPTAETDAAVNLSAAAAYIETAGGGQATANPPSGSLSAR